MTKWIVMATLILGAVAFGLQEDVRMLATAPPIDAEVPKTLETATFALGWFWGPDSQFGSLPGVVRTRVGYAGGTKENPTYRDLGDHTETLQIDFDPKVITYERLLELFWASHNPCGANGSTQYKAIVFTHNAEQRKAVEKTRAALQGKVTTEVRDAGKFWIAEDYHQKYTLRNTRGLMKEFAAIYPNDADFVNSTAAARINGYLSGHGTEEQLRAEADKLGLTEAGLRRLVEAVKDR